MPGSEIAAALNGLSKIIAANPDRARAKFSAATATPLGGLKFRVTGPSGEQIETDMPTAMGGGGSHPNPGWLFRAALAACCATVIVQHAARRGIDLTVLEVTVEGDGDTRGILGLDEEISAGHSAIRTTVRIDAQNETPERLQALVHWALEHSPVACTVCDAPPNTLRLVHPNAPP
jgi:uncharacterized OsmC-like protein